jgi:hypothetical protein
MNSVINDNKKNLDGSAAIQLCFGDISRDEINDVLGADGLSRLPIKVRKREVEIKGLFVTQYTTNRPLLQ